MIKRLVESQIRFTCTSSPGIYIHTVHTPQKCAARESAHTHSRAAKGPRDKLSHTMSEVSHTGESGRMAGRGELSSQKKIRPSRYCLSDLLKRPHTQIHTHSERLSTQSLNSLSIAALKTHTRTRCCYE